MTDILKFYKGQKIFLTGGTGCLGVLILEKLLRYTEVDKIYLLVRSKRGKTPIERLDKIFDDVYFTQLKKENLDFKSKVVLIAGDLEKPHLGINDEDRLTLEKEITCVIHAAANVRFDQSLRMATLNNVTAVKQMLDLAKSMPNLKSYVHVSTAYSNCPFPHIKEEFYEPPMSAEKLFALLEVENDQSLVEITPKLLGNYYNTYCYTKAIGEDMVKNEGKNLPLALVRPAIIMPAYEGTLPGWINNLYGVIGITAGVSIGVMRTFCIKLNRICHLVPCDYVANNILAAAWYAAKTKKTINGTDVNGNLNRSDGSEIPIFNYTGSNKNLITWEQYISNMKALAWKYSTNKTIWYMFFITTESLFFYKILTLFLHMLPAHIIDFFLFLSGKRPKAVKIYQKINKAISLTNPFRLAKWTFDSSNVDKLWESLSQEDREIFRFNMADVDWLEYAHRSVKGSRVYLLKDPLETIAKARRRLIFFATLHYAIVALLIYFLYKFIMFGISFVF